MVRKIEEEGRKIKKGEGGQEAMPIFFYGKGLCAGVKS